MNGIQDMLVNTNMMSHKVLYLECIILIIQFCLLFSIDFKHVLIYFFKALLCTRHGQAQSRNHCEGGKCVPDKGGLLDLGPCMESNVSLL